MESFSWVDPDSEDRAVGLAMIDQNRAEAMDCLRKANGFVVSVSKHEAPGLSDLSFFMCADGPGSYSDEFYFASVRALLEGMAAAYDLPLSVVVTATFQRLLTEIVLKDIPDE